MTDLSALSDDEIVAEMQRRLARGTVGYAGLFSPHQLNYKAMWAGIVETIAQISNEDFSHPLAHRLRVRMHELVDNGAPPVEVFAINTTFYGKDTVQQDHAPRKSA